MEYKLFDTKEKFKKIEYTIKISKCLYLSKKIIAAYPTPQPP